MCRDETARCPLCGKEQEFRIYPSVNVRLNPELREKILDLTLPDMLCQGGLKETQGDIRCVVFGHLIRLAVWHLRDRWNPANSIHEKFAVVGSEVKSLQSKFDMERWLNERTSPLLRRQAWRERENTTTFEGSSDAIPF